MDSTSLVNTFLSKVNCEWGEWVTGECSATCGTGTRDKIRTKDVEENSEGTCIGQAEESESCMVQECPSKYPNY